MRPGFKWFLLLTCLFAPQLAHCFEGDEHEDMGNLALKVAAAYNRADGAKEDLSAASDLGIPFAGVAPTISYGTVVRCVDYFLFPEKILAYAWKTGAEAPAGGLPSEKLRLDKTFAGSCVEGTGFAQASHNNHAHFQHDLLMSFRLYHELAVSIAQREENLYAALVVNAIADHYLHDMFAPGHIVTPREKLTDVVATAVHDLANKNGVPFVPQSNAELADILGFICTGRIGESGDLRCDEDAATWLPALRRGNRVADVSLAINWLLRATPRPMIMRGDSHLWDRSPDQVEQRILLLAVEVQSILDVVRGENTFTDFEWVRQKGDMPMQAKLGFGEYRIGASASEEDASPDTAALDAGLAEAEAAAPGFHSTDEAGPYRLGTMSSIFGISLHREAMSSGAMVGRNVASLDTVPSVFSWETKLAAISNVTIAPTYGMSWYHEGSVSGWGPVIRVPFMVPEASWAIGPYVRYLSYPSIEGDQRKTSYGARFDYGSTDYVTVYLGVGRDYGTNVDGRIQKGWIWTGGFMLNFPRTRLPGFLGGAR